jgi:hypothetical protein
VVGCEISHLSNFVAAKRPSAVVGQKNSSLLNFVKFRNEALWLVGNYPTSQISQHHGIEHSGWLKIIQPPQLKDFATHPLWLVGEKSNLLHFTKEEIERSGWLNKSQPPIIASLSWSS